MLCLTTAALLTMLSEPQSFLLSPGETVDLSCQFNSDDFSMFENPVIWNGTTNTTTPLETKGAEKPFVHFFDTTGILQHNDIAPQWHPTDVGQIKVASHLMQYIKLKFGWELMSTGPE